MAAQRPVVENAAKALVVGANGRTALESLAVGLLRTTSIMKGFADAIVRLLVARGRWGCKISRCIEVV